MTLKQNAYYNQERYTFLFYKLLFECIVLHIVPMIVHMIPIMIINVSSVKLEINIFESQNLTNTLGSCISIKLFFIFSSIIANRCSSALQWHNMV